LCFNDIVLKSILFSLSNLLSEELLQVPNWLFKGTMLQTGRSRVQYLMR
jgi:hypothetical protein